eukprot:3483549-Pyramimonas_sp.AAC.1
MTARPRPRPSAALTASSTSATRTRSRRSHPWRSSRRSLSSSFQQSSLKAIYQLLFQTIVIVMLLGYLTRTQSMKLMPPPWLRLLAIPLRLRVVWI